jgi:hypothetical protein
MRLEYTGLDGIGRTGLERNPANRRGLEATGLNWNGQAEGDRYAREWVGAETGG